MAASGPHDATKPEGYEEFLSSLKRRIRQAQVRAAIAVNRELVLLYWNIGREIVARQVHEGCENANVLWFLPQTLMKSGCRYQYELGIIVTSRATNLCSYISNPSREL
jgi:hypothetical protein